MSFIRQISKVIRKQKRCHPQGKVATNFLLMFSFAVIGLSFLLYGTINGQLAQAQAGEWYHDGGTWNYRQKLNINHLKVKGSLTDFPILVSITDSNLIAKAKANGGDILFTLNDGITKLNHEIEKYDGATGELVAWVKRDISAVSTDTGIYMYYGNATATDQWNIAGVWDVNYKMVQHLNDDNTTTTKDSTANGNNGTKIAAGQPAEVVGKIGMAQSFNGNGKISTPLNTAFGDFTVEVWFKDASPVSSYERLLDKSYTAGFWLGRNNAVANSWGGGIKEGVPPHGIFGAFGDGAWNHLVSVRDGTTHLLYANGVRVNSNIVSGALLDSTSIAIGAWSDPSSPQQKLSGTVDEVRISDAVRSADWIETAYNNESDPSTFVSLFGPEETDVTPVPVITINQPTAATEWQIGDTKTISWTISFPPADPPAAFKLYYSDDNGADWTTIDNVDYQGQQAVQTYGWTIPVTISGPGESDFKIKIEAYDSLSTLVATAESSAFKIDYGPVASWNLEASMDSYPLRPAGGIADTSKLSLDTLFTLKATAKDVHSNVIINQSDPISFNVVTISGGGPVIGIVPNSLGDSRSSVWNSGIASFDNYRLSIVAPQPGDTFPVTINLRASAPSELIKIQLFEYGIFIFEPNSTSVWTIGETKDIIFKFGGLTPTNPNNSFARFYYSQTGNWTTPDSIKDENGNDRKVTYQTDQQLIHVPWLLPNGLDITKSVQIKAEFYDDSGTPANPADDIILASDISDSFNIGGAMALQGTYISAEFDISDTLDADTFLQFSEFDPLIQDSVPGFVATYDEQAGHSDVEFALSFFNSGGQLLGTAVHPDGWFVLDDQDFDASMLELNDYNWLSQIKQIQFRIYMETDDYNSYSPYVEFLELSYEIDTAAQVGTINFESGNTRSIARGSSADFGVRIAIASGYETQISGITLSGEADDATITADVVAIAGTGATNYTADVTFDTTSLTTLGDHAISISAAVTGHPEMTFTPSLLTGILTVTDATAQNFSLTWVGTPPDTNKTVQPGEIASYNFIITWDSSYSYAINLTTDAMTVIGSSYIEKTEFFVDSAPAPVTQATRPSTSPYNRTVEMRVTTKSNSGEKTLTSFNITGASTSIPAITKNISPAPSLTISNQPANVVTIDAKAEVEGGTAASFTAPKFTLRLYKKGATNTYTEKTDIQATSKDAITGQYLIRASFDKATSDTNGKVVVGTTYIGYLRSVRHLWKKATTPTSGEITIIAGTNSYTLEFPKLIAGDISPTPPDNQINSLDFQSSLASFGQTLSNALNDFDNNGQINVLDIGFVLTNYFKKGDLLP